MARTRIKFCGITRPQDAIAAAMLGADAIGLIFYPRSPRYVSVERAKEILAVLPPLVTAVGLFVNSSIDEVRNTAEALHLRTVQLHGDETLEYVNDLKRFSVIKAISSDIRQLSTNIAKWENSGIAGLLLETAGTVEPGGTGIENNWPALIAIKSSIPIIAAGGLTPENVERVVCSLRPWAVDVSTGIEESKGIKSTEKMRRFTEAVHAADMRQTV